MKYAEIEWNTGTPRSARFDDVYFSADNGIEETRHVFLQQNELPQRWQQQDLFVIAETGFGTGLNFLVTMMLWLQSAPADACLHYISIENRPVSPDDIARLAGRWSELEACADELMQFYPPPVPGMHLVELAEGRIRLHLIFDEVEAALEQINCEVDAWYLDGFAPSCNPDMWTGRVFELIGRHTRIGGSFATYTAAGAVRRGLAGAGFVVQKSAGYGAKRDMLKGFIFEQRCYAVEAPWFSLPQHTVDNKHAVIIGAGLSGLATASALIRRGWRITLIDKHATIAQEASGNPAGLLMPRLTQDVTLDARFYVNAFVYAIQCLDKLQAEFKEAFWFKSGNVLIDSADKLTKICESHQYPEAFIRYIESHETQEVAGIDLNRDALLFVNAGWVNVKRLCERLVHACGNRLEYQQAEVSDIEYTDGHWHVTAASGDTVILSACVVLANGDRARSFSDLAWLPVDAARGQITQLEATATSRDIKCGISSERYITPAYNGLHVLGASYQLDNASTVLSAKDQSNTIECINRMIPARFEQRSETVGRVAFRAVSEDRVPVVGCVPDKTMFEQQYHDLHHGRRSKHYPPGAYLPGLYISSAHGSRGLCSCFISAEIIASILCAEPAPVEKSTVDYLNPARFIIRRLKRGRS